MIYVDTIGPYVPEKHCALTVVDKATRWLEVSVRVHNQAKTTAENFDATWLCRYPRPVKVVFDRGTELNTAEFLEMSVGTPLESRYQLI